MFASHVRHQLAAYCHGELSDAEANRVRQHLERCRRCRSEYDQIRVGASLADQLSMVPAPATLWSRVEAVLDNPPGHAGRPTPARPALPLGWRRLAAIGAAAVLAVGIIAAGLALRTARRSWEVESVAGAPVVGSERIHQTGRLRVGQWLVTDSSSKAKISNAEIGIVEVEPNTRLQLRATRGGEHRLGLAKGAIEARVSAPPRIFFVETPSAVAVDLGCYYTLEVGGTGRGLLRVALGWVAFTSNGRESIVPRDAACETRRGIGPGTPYFEDAPKALRSALEKLDFENGGAPALGEVLAAARGRDTLTLWHLLARVADRERAEVYDRLATLSPPPPGVTRAGILQLDKPMLDLWREDLDDMWWD